MRENSDNRKTGRPRRRTGVSLKIPVLIIVLILAIMTTVALMLPAFNVVEVYCEGNSEVKTEDIITAARLEVGKNIFLENLGKARRNVESINNIKSAEIRRVFPNKICISVSERVPFAYVPSGGGLALISEDETVIKVPDGGETAVITQAKTPKLDNGQQSTDNTDSNKSDGKSADNGGDESDGADNSDKSGDNSEKSDSNSENKTSDSQGADKPDSNNSDNNQNGSNNENGSVDANNADITSVPLVSGIELNNAQEGKKAESGDTDKFNKLYELCRALKGAELLNRTTYINIENLNDITVVIENRLEVQLAKADNINYRCRFLAEVINTKLSATESVILDYRGDDIYAINRDDGGERVKKTKSSKSSDNKENSDNKKTDSDDSDTNNSNNSNNSDDSDNSDDTNSSATGGSSAKKSSGSAQTNTNSVDEQDEYL